MHKLGSLLRATKKENEPEVCMRCCASNLFGSSSKINSQPLIGGALSPVRSEMTTHTLLTAVYFLAFATIAICLDHGTAWSARHILYKSQSPPSTVWPRPTTQNASSNHKWRKEVSCTVHSRQPSSLPWYVLCTGCSEADLYALVCNKTETRCPQCANRDVECDTEVSIFFFF